MPDTEHDPLQEVPVLKTRLDQLDKSLADSNKRMENGFREVEDRLSQFERNIIARIDSQSRDKRSTWGTVVAVVSSIGVAVCIALWGAIKMQTDSTVSPIRSDTTYLLTTVQQLRADRDTSVERLAELSRQFATSEAQRKANWSAAEKQFDMTHQLHNTQWAEQERVNAVMWNALHAMDAKLPEYPTGPFFQPNISHLQASGD